jgi:DNA-directed RNA polymerase subunit RPC12/RpoP
MDIIFDCPNCSQELAVDSAGAGTDIECPSCGETITIPAGPEKPPSDSKELAVPNLSASPIASSAAAKVEKHLRVPVRTSPAEPLIAKANPPLGARMVGDKQVRIRTIRRVSCIESGHDNFDDVVSKFLKEIGEPNLMSVHTIYYSFYDVATQKLVTDYGIMIVYRG